MVYNSLTVSTSLLEQIKSFEDLNLQQLETVRLVLRGGSVIDWSRLNFETEEEIERLLRVNEFDVNDQKDVERLLYLRDRAIQYMEKALHFNVPDIIKNYKDIRKLFLNASNKNGDSKLQKYSCMLLKVMTIMQHLEGRDLLYISPISEHELYELVCSKVTNTMEQLINNGCPVYSFSGGRKSKNSMVTKLLVKRDNIAAQVFDKYRFRVVVEEHKDIIPVIYWMTQWIFPFNYIIPGQSGNKLIDLKSLLENSVTMTPIINKLQIDIGTDGEEKREEEHFSNEFSSKSFKDNNFIVDLPIKLEPYLIRYDDPSFRIQGNIVYVLVEFQVVDRKSDMDNDKGETSHYNYKKRQLKNVRHRLEKGS